MAEKAATPINRFRTVGYLTPSHNGKSFKVTILVEDQQKFIGLVPRSTLLRSLYSRPMFPVEIATFIIDPQREKPTMPKACPVCDPEKLSKQKLQESKS